MTVDNRAEWKAAGVGDVEPTPITAYDCEPNEVLDRAEAEWAARRASIAWWCARCRTPHRSGSPEDGCPDCGFRQEVLP